MLDLSFLIRPSFWLTNAPANVGSGAGRFLLLVFLGCLIAGVVVRRKALLRSKDRYDQAFYGRLVGMLVTMGLVGVFLFFFSYEQIRLFGARFWYPVWFLGVAVWTFFLVRFVKKEAPRLRLKERQRLQKEKYFPGRKK